MRNLALISYSLFPYLFNPSILCPVVSELLTYTPVRNTFTNGNKEFMYNCIYFSLVIAGQNTFPKLLWSAHFLPSISVRLCHVFVIQLDLLVCLTSWDPPLLTPPPPWLILQICIHWISLLDLHPSYTMCNILWVLTNAQNHVSTTAVISNTEDALCASPFTLNLFPNPGNQWSVVSVSTVLPFAECQWNRTIQQVIFEVWLLSHNKCIYVIVWIESSFCKNCWVTVHCMDVL